MSIAKNLTQVWKEIHDAERDNYQKTGLVRLIAVSKGQSVEKIKQAIDFGQTSFGENYLQEALPKIATLQNYHCEWHFIGQIQSNKTSAIAENFSWVQSVCRGKIAIRLNNSRPAEFPPLNVCIQMRCEETSYGLLLSQLDELIEMITSCPKLRLRGLMVIPRRCTGSELQTKFAKIKFIYEQLQHQGLQLDTLSMGMSDDFVMAIKSGATMVRIGTRIFGSRNYDY